MFTQSEITLLKNMLKYSVQHIELLKKPTKVEINDLWKDCDKTTQEGINSFLMLNAEKDYLRMLCKKHKQYSSILYKLKKLQKVQNV
jgi:hypothetical protein